eukprot:798998-Amphidinium_carterae.2
MRYQETPEVPNANNKSNEGWVANFWACLPLGVRFKEFAANKSRMPTCSREWFFYTSHFPPV